jgi:hypothetical protein
MKLSSFSLEGLQTASRDITEALDPAPTMQSSVFELIPRLRSSGSRSGIDETSKDDFAFRKTINVTLASTYTPAKELEIYRSGGESPS